MFKQKVKLSLIDDYIILLKLEKELCYCVEDVERLHFNKKLIMVYENLLFKYGLMDVSLLVLKKEIQSCEFGVGLNLEQIKLEQLNLVNLLIDKMKKLKLNDIEQRFLTKNLNVKIC